MIIAHIITNIIFWLFFVFDIWEIRKKHSNKRGYKFFLSSIVLGILTYMSYAILLLSYFSIDGFDKETLSLLILGWAFMFAAYMIRKKDNCKNSLS